MQRHAEALVDDYLGRLEAAAHRLPAGRGAELVAETRDHIDLALAATGRDDEATVRTVLDRLGPPETIVAAEAPGDADEPGTSTGSGGRSVGLLAGWGPNELIALLLLSVGIFALPVVGPLLGLVFLWASKRWTVQHKLLVTAIVAILIVGPVIGLFAAGAGGSAGDGLG
jgi:hypothetical protein